LGSSNGAGRGTVGVGIGVECVALGARPLGEERVMVEPERRRSSTTSTIPTTPTTSAVAVAVAATATRVVLPTCVTVPRGTTNEAACKARSARSERSERSNQTRRSRAHMLVCKLYPCAALSKVHNNSSPTLPYKRCPAA
jgi:hypothetical protein